MYATTLALLVLAFLPAQETEVRVRITLRDKSTVMGLPDDQNLKIATSLGSHELPIADLRSVTLDDKGATLDCQDGTKLKGTLSLDAVGIKCLLGAVKVKRELVAKWDYYPALKSAPGIPAEVETIVRLNDGNELVGTSQDFKPVFECALGTFNLELPHIVTLSRLKDGDWLNLKDGTALPGKLKLAEFKLKARLGEFTIKPEQISSFSAGRPLSHGPRPSSSDGKGAPPRGGGSEAPSSAPAPDLALKPSAKASQSLPLSRFHVTKDGKKLYAIALSDGKLVSWDLPGLTPGAEVELTDGERSIALTPSESKVLAIGKSNISVFSLPDLKKTKSFSVEFEPIEAVAVDEDLVLATSGQGARLVSLARSSVTQKLQGGNGPVRIARERDRAFTVGGVAFLRNLKDGAGVEWTGTFGGGQLYSPYFEISTDARYGVTGPDGQVYRLGRSSTAAIVPMARVEPHLAGVFSPDASMFYAFTHKGFLHVYDTADFRITKTVELKVVGLQAWMDPGGSAITVAAAPVGTANAAYSPAWNSTLATLYRFELPK
jgi:WD40 repeat protein